MDDMNFYIQIEEKQREKTKKFHASTSSEVGPNANVVQSKKSNWNIKRFKKGESSNSKKYGPWKKQMSDKNCYVCGKAGNFTRNYIHKKSSNEEKMPQSHKLMLLQ